MMQPLLDAGNEAVIPSAIYTVPIGTRNRNISGWRHHVANFNGKRARELAPFVLLILVFVFFGLTGHDPWKADEAYVFGVIHTMDISGNWLIPTVGGEPFMEKPPLYYWVAAGCMRLLSGWMDEPDAARMASGLFMLITCWAVAAATRDWWGRGVGRYAPLLVLACLGTLTQTHMMMPDVPLLTGFALSAWGFSRLLQQPMTGGILLGLGTGISFLSKGILGPAVIGLTGVLLPVCFAQWRRMNYFRGLLVAFLTALPFLVIWPGLLFLRAPTLFHVWFWDNNFGRFFGFSEVHTGTEHQPGFWWQTLPWFTFPALPLAALVLWSRRREIVAHAGMQYALIAFAVPMLVLITSESVRAIYALPLLVPLAIMAAPSVLLINARFDRFWAGSSIALFGVMAAVIWSIWGIMMRTDAPPIWRWLLRVLPGDFEPDFEPWTLTVAVLVTVGACIALWQFSKLPGRGLTAWLTGLTLTWALLSSLLMPWLDYGKSYRTVFEEIPWPAGVNCVESIGLGESERAMLHYVAGRVTARLEVLPSAQCNTLLMQGYVPIGNGVVDPDRWEKIWEGARPGDTWQRFWLFRERRSVASMQLTNRRNAAQF